MPVKSVPIQLDKRRNLRFNTNAICILEEELNISVFNIGELFGFSFNDSDIMEDIVEKGAKALSPKVAIEMASRIKLKNLRALLWVALLHEDKDLTLEQAGELMDSINNLILIEKLLEAYSVAIPKTDGVKKNATGSNPKELTTGKSI